MTARAGVLTNSLPRTMSMTEDNIDARITEKFQPIMSRDFFSVFRPEAETDEPFIISVNDSSSVGLIEAVLSFEAAKTELKVGDQVGLITQSNIADSSPSLVAMLCGNGMYPELKEQITSLSPGEQLVTTFFRITSTAEGYIKISVNRWDKLDDGSYRLNPEEHSKATREVPLEEIFPNRFAVSEGMQRDDVGGGWDRFIKSLPPTIGIGAALLLFAFFAARGIREGEVLDRIAKLFAGKDQQGQSQQSNEVIPPVEHVNTEVPLATQVPLSTPIPPTFTASPTPSPTLIPIENFANMSDADKYARVVGYEGEPMYLSTVKPNIVVIGDDKAYDLQTGEVKSLAEAGLKVLTTKTGEMLDFEAYTIDEIRDVIEADNPNLNFDEYTSEEQKRNEVELYANLYDITTIDYTPGYRKGFSSINSKTGESYGVFVLGIKNTDGSLGSLVIYRDHEGNYHVKYVNSDVKSLREILGKPSLIP